MSQADDKFSVRFRVVSGSEFLLCTAKVVGHNILRVIPNEVPILFVLGLLSLRLHDRGWITRALNRPISWVRTVQVALAAAALRIALTEFVIEPLTSRSWPPIVAPAASESIAGNAKVALLALLFVWTFAAFGEELGYRGYLLTRAADLGKRSVAAYWIGILAVSVLFGLGHYFKGPAGILDSGVAGVILGGTHMLSGRNLWASILAHGFIDTYAVAILFLGWQS
jgi:membrane protease YdiL (CAAX protease family)